MSDYILYKMTFTEEQDLVLHAYNMTLSLFFTIEKNFKIQTFKFSKNTNTCLH